MQCIWQAVHLTSSAWDQQCVRLLFVCLLACRMTVEEPMQLLQLPPAFLLVFMQ
jgi:hypothetical protein